jgi:hypothetical protein
MKRGTRAKQKAGQTGLEFDFGLRLSRSSSKLGGGMSRGGRTCRRATLRYTNRTGQERDREGETVSSTVRRQREGPARRKGGAEYLVGSSS